MEPAGVISETARDRDFTFRELRDPSPELLEACDLDFVKASRWAIQELSDFGHYEEGVQVVQRLLTAQERVYGKEDSEYLRNTFQLAKIRLKQEHFEDAEDILTWLLATRKRILGSEHKYTINAMTTLALCYSSLGKLVEAEDLFNQALEIKDPERGSDHSATLITWNNLGLVYMGQERYEAAKEIFEKSLTGLEKQRDFDDLDLLATLDNLASVHQHLHELDKAEGFYKRLLTIRVKSWGCEHPETLDTMIKFANFHEDTESFDKAQVLLERVLAAKRHQLGDEHLKTLDAYYKVARMCFKRELYPKALAMAEYLVKARESLPGYGMYLGSTSKLTECLCMKQFLGTCYQKNDRIDEAEWCHREIVEALEGTEDDDHLLSCTLYHLGILLQRHSQRDRWPEAEHYLKRVLPVFRSKIREHHERIIIIVQALVEIYQSQDRQREAKDLLNDNVAMTEDTYGSDSLQVASALVRLAFFYEDTANWKDASRFMTRALHIREQKLGADHWQCFVPLQSLAGCAEMQRQLDEAVELWGRALGGLEREYGSTDDETWEVARKILNLLNELGRHEEEVELVQHFSDLGVKFKKRASSESKDGDVNLAASIDNQEIGQPGGTGDDSQDNHTVCLSEDSKSLVSCASKNRQNKL